MRWAASAALCLALVPLGARAQEPLGYAVNARIHADSGDVEGAMHVWVRVPEGATEVRLWLYPDRLAEAPTAMDERSARWVYPRQIDRGGIEVTDLSVDGAPVTARREAAAAGELRGRDFAGADLVVPVAAGPARRIELRARFRLDLPRRFGRLGRVRNRITLAAPWYPLVVGEDDAYRYGVPQRVRVELAGGGEMLVGGRVTRGIAEVETDAAFVPVIVARRLHVRERPVRGVSMRVLSHRELYTPPRPHAEGEHGLRDLLRVDAVGLIEDRVDEALTTVRQAGVPIDRPERIDIVLVPLRTELVATAPGMVLVSDRIYEVFPPRFVRQFHDHALRRAAFRHLVAPLSDQNDPPADRDWADDLRAVLLLDLDAVRRNRPIQSTEDVIGWAGFHPSVDQLLYAPQISFVDVYFGSVDEPDPFRDDPARARRPQARGRALLERARDALDREAFERFAHALLLDEGSARDAIVAARPELAARLPIWLATPGLEVNYRLGEIRSERAGDHWVSHIEIIRDGAERPEPVEILVEDEAGNRVRARWDGEGSRGVVTVETEAPLDDVSIDPRGRLPQSADVADGHPLRDDTTQLPWRPPILLGFSGSVSATEGTVTGFVEVGLRRKYDLENTFSLFGATGVRSTGGSLRYIRGVGRKLDTNTRIASVSVGLGLSRLRSGSFSEQAEDGWRLSLSAGAGFNTRRYLLDPRSGASLGGSVRLNGVHQDDGDLTWSIGLGLRGSYTVPVGLRNAFVFIADVAAVLGDPLDNELPGIAGVFEMRGFENDEGIGDAVGLLIAEHRWTVFSDLSVNAFHLAWVREIQLALFAAASVTVNPIDRREHRELVGEAEVGGGVRFHFEYGGVQPGVLAIDVGVPLTRYDEARARRAPVAVHVGFDQLF